MFVRCAHLGIADNGLSIAQIRRETPGCRRVTHLNNAGCALPSRVVMQATDSFYKLEARYGGYEMAEKYGSTRLRKPYEQLGKLLNCFPDEIAILPSATSAWQQVVFGMDFKAGDVVLTTPNEYGSNFINLLQLQSKLGIKIIVIPERENGDLDLGALEDLVLKNKPKLLALTHVPTSSGNVYDAIEVGKITGEYNVPYLLDACQTVGQMEVDVDAIQCDFLSATSRKFIRGPRGIGFLYAARRTRDVHEPAFLDIRSAVWETEASYVPLEHAMRYEQYEINFAAKCGFGAAVEYCRNVGVNWIEDRVRYLADHFRRRLRENSHIHVHDHGPQLCGIVSFTMERHSSDAVCSYLRERSINVSVSRRPSTRLKFEQQGLDAVVRASVHYYNTEEELELCFDALNTLSKQSSSE